MAFVNEYASDEDIKKYKLNEIWDEYHPFRQGDYYAGNRPLFTIDRQREIFLMVIGQGTGELGNRTRFLLWWKGVHIRVDLDLVEGSSKKITESPFFLVWDLVWKQIPDSFKETETEMLDVLKAAVSAYGYWGVRQEIPNTIVNFSF